MAETKNFMAKLVRAWPALPHMALGALLASVYIASSGTAWLSDSEINGGNLSVLTVTMSLSAGGLMLLSTFAVPRVRSWLEAPDGVPLGGGGLLARRPHRHTYRAASFDADAALSRYPIAFLHRRHTIRRGARGDRPALRAALRRAAAAPGHPVRGLLPVRRGSLLLHCAGIARLGAGSRRSQLGGHGFVRCCCLWRPASWHRSPAISSSRRPLLCATIRAGRCRSRSGSFWPWSSCSPASCPRCTRIHGGGLLHRDDAVRVASRQCSRACFWRWFWRWWPWASRGIDSTSGSCTRW